MADVEENNGTEEIPRGLPIILFIILKNPELKS